MKRYKGLPQALTFAFGCCPATWLRPTYHSLASKQTAAAASFIMLSSTDNTMCAIRMLERSTPALTTNAVAHTMLCHQCCVSEYTASNKEHWGIGYAHAHAN